VKTPKPVVNDYLIEHHSSEITWTEQNEEKVVTAASMEALSMFLLDPDQDELFVKALLLVHAQFMSSRQLIKKMRSYLTQIINSKDKKQKKVGLDIAIGVVKKILLKWLDYNFFDFYNSDIFNRLWKLIELFDTDDEFKNQFNYEYEIRKEAMENLDKIDTPSLPNAPKPRLGKKVKGYIKSNSIGNFTDINTTELARQITLIDHLLLSQIPSIEFLNKNFSKEETSPHIAAISNQFNRLSQWVSSEIVTTPNIRQRIKVLGYFINLAVKLLSLNNFTGLMAVYAGLTQFTVSRMKLTWKNLTEKLIEKWEKLETLCSPFGNFKGLRTLHEISLPPVVQTPTIFIKDLVFIEELKDKHENTELLNVTKLNLLGKVIEKIQTAQSIKYMLNSIPVIQQFIKEELYIISLQDQEENSKMNEPPSSLNV